MNDLDHFLKQYGQDLRFQETVARQLRRKARRQCSAVAMCAVVLLAFIGVLLWGQPAEVPAPILAEEHVPHLIIEPEPDVQVTAGKVCHFATYHNTIHRTATDSGCGVKSPMTVVDVAACSDENEFVFLVKEGEQLPEMCQHDESLLILDAPMEDMAELNMPSSSHRLHWDVSLSAGRGGQGYYLPDNFGMGPEINSSNDAVSEKNSFSADALGMLSGNVGVNMILASFGRSRLEMGVAVEGYMNRVNVSITQKS